MGICHADINIFKGLYVLNSFRHCSFHTKWVWILVRCSSNRFVKWVGSEDFFMSIWWSVDWRFECFTFECVGIPYLLLALLTRLALGEARALKSGSVANWFLSRSFHFCLIKCLALVSSGISNDLLFGVGYYVYGIMRKNVSVVFSWLKEFRFSH